MTEIGPASGSILDTARALSLRIGTVCGVERILTGKPELGAQLREALAADVPGASISAALKRLFGIDLPAQAIQRHRRGVCRCPSS